MTLLDLVVKTGIANAIAIQLGGLKGNKNAIAETIENVARSWHFLLNMGMDSFKDLYEKHIPESGV